MYPTLNLKNSCLLSLNGMSRTLFSSDSELLLVVADQLDLLQSMTTNKAWLNTNLITDLEDQKFSPKEILKEKPRNNSKEKLKKLEVQKRLKFQLLEKQKPEQTLKKLKKLSLRKSSLSDSMLSRYLSFILINYITKNQQQLFKLRFYKYLFSLFIYI